MKFVHIAGRIFHRPLLIEPGALNAVLAFLVPRMEGREVAPDPELSARRKLDAMANYAGMPSLDDGRNRSYKVLPSGVAILPIVGKLVNREMPMDAMSGGPLTYTSIGTKLTLCLADPGVKGVLLDVDSPGGEVGGCFELAEKIHEANQQKPIWSLANSDAYSGGYALACAAQKVFVVNSGGVGSIGVILQYLDQTAWDKAIGVRYGVIKAGARKNDFNPHFEVEPKALEWAQAEVERCAGEFYGLVSRYRSGLSPEQVKALEAGLFFGPNAVEAGLADEVSTLDKVLAEFETALSAENQGEGAAAGRAIAKTDMEVISMSGEKGKGKPAADADAGKVEAQAQAGAESAVDGAGAERERIAAILDSPEAEGREALAKHLAFETTMDAGAAKAALAKAPQAAGGMQAKADELGAGKDLLSAAMDAEGNPKVGADSGQGEMTEAGLAARILAADESEVK